MKKQYKQPEAQHWVVLRLVKQVLKAQGGHARDSGLSTVWLMREVGSQRLIEMIDQLHAEEGTKP
jgi:hypothetical protein